MKVIVAGSRGIRDSEKVFAAIRESGFDVTEVVSGGARGVDTIGEKWARLRNLPVKRFLPEWGKHMTPEGRDVSALVRNIEMAQYADALVAVYDGKSTGTPHMIKEAKKHGLRVHKVDLSENRASSSLF